VEAAAVRVHSVQADDCRRALRAPDVLMEPH
jgi:hypothetical protein